MLLNSKNIIKKRILYAEAVFGQSEKKAVLKSMDNRFLAAGPLVKKFEEKIAKLFGKKYGIAVNSGSSANFLALQSLRLPEESEVITPGCTFSTTASPIVFNRLTPVFIDSVIGRYTINENLIEKAITNKTKVIMIPQLIGGVCNMKRIRKIADKHNLVVIDDSCDTLAPMYKDKPIALYADISTTSFYGSHIITTFGSGGMVLTDSKYIRDRVISIRDWGRVGNDAEPFENRFNFKIDGIPYDAKFLYAELGHNCKMTEASAAFGLVQLKKLKKFTKTRKRNFLSLISYFGKYEKWFYLPYTLDSMETTWLAFPLTIKKDAPFDRYHFLKYLEESSIQTRVLFSGNITRHPAYKKIAYRIVGTLENADYIMANSFLIGCHQGLSKGDINYLTKKIEIFLKRYVSHIN